MAGDEPLTPEKQLLKLIEDPKPEVLKAAQAKRLGKERFSLSALKGRLAFFQKFSFGKWANFQQGAGTASGIAGINTILKVLVVFLSLYQGYDVMAMVMKLNQASNLILEPGKNVTIAVEQPAARKNISYYADKVATRDLFRLETVTEPPPRKPISKEVEVNTVAKNFSLVGIAWSDDPEAMIEDTASKRTHFVKRGQTISGQVTVVTIFKDRVVLSYKDKEFELK